jgi:F-type H+-transporting ATPase subunit b
LLAIDTREKKIAADIADATAKLAEAQKQGDLYRTKTEAFDKQRAALLQTATDAAETERQRLLDQARKDADALGVKRRDAQIDEANTLAQSIARRTGEQVFAIARKALADLASASLEERVVEMFIQRLRQMSGQAKDDLGDALKTTSDPALLRSAFAKKIPVRYETTPDLVSGIDLSANGRKVGWSIAGYLGELEKKQPVGTSP